MLWHYALYGGEPRVRLADTMHDLSCESTEILGELSDDGYEDDEVASVAAPAAAGHVDQSPSAAASPTVDGIHTQNVSAAALPAAAVTDQAASPTAAASPTVVVVSSEEKSAAFPGEAPGVCHHAVTPVCLNETHFDETEDDVEDSHEMLYTLETLVLLCYLLEDLL